MSDLTMNWPWIERGELDHAPCITMYMIRVHARKCRISYFIFVRFWGSNNFSQKYFPRVGPSLGNSLCKNLKKWEKNAIKSWKWCFFRDFREKWLNILSRFSAILAWFWAIFRYFLSILIKNGLFLSYFHSISGKYWLNSVKFNQGVVQDLVRNFIDFHWFSMNFIWILIKMGSISGKYCFKFNLISFLLIC